MVGSREPRFFQYPNNEDDVNSDLMMNSVGLLEPLPIPMAINAIVCEDQSVASYLWKVPCTRFCGVTVSVSRPPPLLYSMPWPREDEVVFLAEARRCRNLECDNNSDASPKSKIPHR